LKLSELLQISDPLPFTVKVPVEALNVVLPARPGVPMSPSLQPEGRTAAFTVKLTVAAWERLPLVAVIVSVYVPAGVEEEVVTLSVDVPEPESDAGLNVPVVPVGSPPIDRLTVPLKPLSELTLAA